MIYALAARAAEGLCPHARRSGAVIKFEGNWTAHESASAPIASILSAFAPPVPNLIFFFQRRAMEIIYCALKTKDNLSVDVVA